MDHRPRRSYPGSQTLIFLLRWWKLPFIPNSFNGSSRGPVEGIRVRYERRGVAVALATGFGCEGNSTEMVPEGLLGGRWS